MKIGKKNVKIFRIKNRQGFAAICEEHLTEGGSEQQAYDRMVKAIHRTEKTQR